MADVFEHITESVRELIVAQHIFFVATAPLSADGYINISPKGLDCFRVLSPNHVVYLDLVGSGNETSAHLLENGRITFMFCTFEGAPNIIRLYGTGRTIRSADPEWPELLARFPDYFNTRQIISVEIDRVQTSCGFAVPLMDFVADRDTLSRWAKSRGEEGLARYQCENNAKSIDGLATPIGLEINQRIL